MPTDPAPGPLAGLVVVDLSTVLAGPLCTMVLGDLGAEVIKVEPPTGDATRGWGPPWVGTEEDRSRTAAYFLAVNRNKRSLRVDLRRPDGRDVLTRLLSRANVLVDNFRPGVLADMGLGEEALRERHPRLVHLAISGYGPDGPDARRPGYDFVLQGEAGLMSITGQPDDDGGRPTKVGVAIADVVTGLFGAVGVLASLVVRNGAGQAGRRVDVSILESTLAVLVNQAQNAFVSGRAPGRRGNAHPNIVPYETFATADGEIVVAAGSERQWARLCDALVVQELRDDPRFATNGGRVEHRDTLRTLLAGRFASRGSAEWLTTLDAAEVPAGRINDVLEAFDTPQARARGVRVELEHPVLGAVDQVRSAISLDGAPGAILRPPPLLGEHTDEILRELGFAAAEIGALRERGTV